MSALKLEVFETPQAASSTTVVTDVGALEETKLASYEQGYSAGWEDATAAQAGDQTQIRADLARNLQTLSFTYHDARAHVLRAIEPVFEKVLLQILPEMAREAIAPMVLETLMPLTETMADAPVSLVLNPASRMAVEGLLEQATGLPITITEEPSLGAGQVYLRLGATETQIDLDRVTSEILCGSCADFLAIQKRIPRMDDMAQQNPFSQVPIEITISVGKARPQVRELLKLQKDAVLTLDRRVDDPVELYVGDRLIARGELQELEGEQAGQLAVRLIEVANLRGGL